jgi:homoserine dehydrogenase
MRSPRRRRDPAGRHPSPVAAAATLRDEQVSMEAMIQRARAPDEPVPVVLTTHETEETAMRRALKRIATLGTVTEPSG